MAWQTPRTWVDGETITTQMLNDHIRDELLALFTPPAARMAHTANQSIAASGADIVVAWDTSIFDTDAMVNIASNRLDIKTAGKFSFGSQINWASTTDASSYRSQKIKHTRGGTTTVIGEVRGVPNFAGAQSLRYVGACWDCQVGDFVQVTGAHASTPGAINIVGPGATASFFWGYRVGS